MTMKPSDGMGGALIKQAKPKPGVTNTQALTFRKTYTVTQWPKNSEGDKAHRWLALYWLRVFNLLGGCDLA